MANTTYYGSRTSRPSYGYDDQQQPSSTSTFSSFPSSSSPVSRQPSNSAAPPPAYQSTARGRSHSAAGTRAPPRRGPSPSPGPTRKGALIAAVTGATLATVADKYFVQDMMNGRHKKKAKPAEKPEELFRRLADITIGGYLGVEAYSHAKNGTFGEKVREFDPADHMPGNVGGGGGRHHHSHGRGGGGGGGNYHDDHPDYEVEEYSDEDDYYDRDNRGSRRRRASSYDPAGSGGRSSSRRKSKSTLLSIMDGLKV